MITKSDERGGIMKVAAIISGCVAGAAAITTIVFIIVRKKQGG